jgi:hypothetical protein
MTADGSVIDNQYLSVDGRIASNRITSVAAVVAVAKAPTHVVKLVAMSEGV